MSSPATQSSSSSVAQPAKKFYMDPVVVKNRVGYGIKATNPLLQFIPECKNIDEFNAFTKTDTYRKLMDFRNPMVEIKMDPSLRKYYEKLQNDRRLLLETKDYPIYAKLPAARMWYRATWVGVVLLSAYSLNNVYKVISTH